MWRHRSAMDNAYAQRHGTHRRGMAARHKQGIPELGIHGRNGATTTWELWNGNTASPKMNSGNHVMLLGDLVSWIYQDLGGINSDPDNPGYKHIILKPDFSVDEIDDISTSYKSIYGNIQSKWKSRTECCTGKWKFLPTPQRHYTCPTARQGKRDRENTRSPRNCQ